MARLAAEFLGTLILVLFGCGAAVLGGDNVGQLGIALAFGFAIVALAYGLGPISGGHVNPAVSLGMFLSGRMTIGWMFGYWAAQFAGALAGGGASWRRSPARRRSWGKTAGGRTIWAAFRSSRPCCSRS